jgi:hypothetical protein
MLTRTLEQPGHRRALRSCAPGGMRYLAFVSHALDRDGALSQLHDLPAHVDRALRLRGWPRALRCGRWAPWSPHAGDPGRRASRTELFDAALPASRSSRARARGPTRCSGSPPRADSATARSVELGAARAAPARLYQRNRDTRRLAVVRGPRHVLQRAPAPGAHRGGEVAGPRRDAGRRPALARVAGRGADDRGRALRAGRLDGFSRRGAPRPSSTSSRWRLVAWSRRASRPTGPPMTGWLTVAGAPSRWFLGKNQLDRAALRPEHRRLPRRPPRRPPQREPGRRVDAVLPAGAGGAARARWAGPRLLEHRGLAAEVHA